MRAIVLSGGGAKGSYQIGVWRALRELGISYEIVCGTSVGALNGLFFTTGEYALAKYIWSTIQLEDILKGTDAYFLEKSKTIIPYIGHYLFKGSFDNTPLKKLACELIDLKKLRKSSIRFGIVTTSLPSLYPVKVEVNQLEEDKICSFLLASSALFPAFPTIQIEGQTYMDGGLFDNLPIDFALEMGADQIFAIGLKKGDVLDEKYQNIPNILYLTPSKDLGGVLDFDHQKILANMRLGYEDALHFFQKNHF